MGKLLDTIDEPSKLKKLNTNNLYELANEIRKLIVDTVSKNGGHLAPSLGTVELTLALHSVFAAPRDKIVWDVGHQAYTHKILTGRRDSFFTLRRKDGITGFPNQGESPYDSFGVGHASTSISAALGMAIARDLDSKNYYVIAIVGDGALTGGEAFEALNQAGDLKKNLIVILNDNEMSIDKNVGAVSTYLSNLRLMPKYNRAKKDMEQFIKHIPRIGDKMYKAAEQVKSGVKSALVPGTFFEELGFQYIGPIDGHNIETLKQTLANIKRIDGPILLHVHTHKGHGYKPAEDRPEVFHGVGKFNVETGALLKKNDKKTYTDIFSSTLIDIAKEHNDIVAITAAMPSGTGLKSFGEVYPARFIDVGIAEEHAITLAAGLASNGKRPVVALYSTFAQRAYDQIVHDVCLQNLPVTICLDRAGLVGEDGATHHGVFDYSFLRHIPNITIMAPMDGVELEQMLRLAANNNSPTVIRYPKGTAWESGYAKTKLEIGKGEIIKADGEIALLAIGSMVKTALETAEFLVEKNIKAAVANMKFVKPIDTALIESLAESKKLLITIEENILAGGFGSAVIEHLTTKGINTKVMRFGIGDEFISQGTRDELLDSCGLTAEKIAALISDSINI